MVVREWLQEQFRAPCRAHLARRRPVVASGQVANRSVGQPGPKCARHEWRRAQASDFLTSWRLAQWGPSSYLCTLFMVLPYQQRLIIIRAVTGRYCPVRCTWCQGCGLGRDVSVSRRSRDVLTSRLGLDSEGLVHIPAWYTLGPKERTCASGCSR